MSQKIVLMSSPEYFKVEYAINPWMVPGTNVDLELAKNQWNGLKRTIEEAGAISQKAMASQAVGSKANKQEAIQTQAIQNLILAGTEAG